MSERTVPSGRTIKLRQARKDLDRLLADHRRSGERVAEEEGALAAARREVALTAQAQEVIQTCAKEVQQRAHRQIARVVSKSLSAVFKSGYELEIVFERRRGRTEADFLYRKDGQLTDPGVDSGGVLDVADLSCRLASLALSLPPAAKVLVLDEPFRMVDKKVMPALAELVLVLSKEMGVQFLIITHADSLRIGKIVRLGS